MHTEVREIDCHPQGLKHSLASGRDWRNNLGTEVMGGSPWVPEAPLGSRVLISFSSVKVVPWWTQCSVPTPGFDSSFVISSCYISFAGTSIQTLQVHLVLHNGERNWGNHPSRSFLKRGREERKKTLEGRSPRMESGWLLTSSWPRACLSAVLWRRKTAFQTCG